MLHPCCVHYGCVPQRLEIENGQKWTLTCTPGFSLEGQRRWHVATCAIAHSIWQRTARSRKENCHHNRAQNGGIPMPQMCALCLTPAASAASGLDAGFARVWQVSLGENMLPSARQDSRKVKGAGCNEQVDGECHLYITLPSYISHSWSTSPSCFTLVVYIMDACRALEALVYKWGQDKNPSHVVFPTSGVVIPLLPLPPFPLVFSLSPLFPSLSLSLVLPPPLPTNQNVGRSRCPTARIGATQQGSAHRAAEAFGNVSPSSDPSFFLRGLDSVGLVCVGASATYTSG